MVQLGVWEERMTFEYGRELQERRVVEAVDGSGD